MSITEENGRIFDGITARDLMTIYMPLNWKPKSKEHEDRIIELFQRALDYDYSEFFDEDEDDEEGD